MTALRQTQDRHVLVLELTEDADSDSGRLSGGLAEQLTGAWRRLDEDEDDDSE